MAAGSCEFLLYDDDDDDDEEVAVVDVDAVVEEEDGGAGFEAERSDLVGAAAEAGIVAAGALHALDRHVDRQAEDHAHARTLADGLAQLPGITISPETVETNIVRFDVADPVAFCAELADHGVLMAPLNATTVRAVTHLDVDAAGIDTALVAAARIAG